MIERWLYLLTFLTAGVLSYESLTPFVSRALSWSHKKNKKIILQLRAQQSQLLCPQKLYDFYAYKTVGIEKKDLLCRYDHQAVLLYQLSPFFFDLSHKCWPLLSELTVEIPSSLALSQYALIWQELSGLAHALSAHWVDLSDDQALSLQLNMNVLHHLENANHVEIVSQRA